MRGIIIYVAGIDENDDFRVASIDPAVAPRTETDSGGSFVFQDLQPGRYALVALTPTELILLQDADQKPIVFEAQADTATSLGDLSVAYEFPDGE